MSNAKIIVLGVVSLLVVAVIAVGVWAVSTSNREVSLRTRAAAKQKANQASFDTMWKILQQKAGVTNEYKQAFKDIFPDLIKGRYSGADGKGLLFKMVTESNPKFSVSLYKDLMRSIESERKSFLTDQKELVDIKREHDNIRLQFPSSLVVGSRPELEVVIVTSDKADDAFRTGQDNDVDLFKKPDAKGK